MKSIKFQFVNKIYYYNIKNYKNNIKMIKLIFKNQN